MADPLSFDALASSEHVLSSAENFVLYVLLEAVARGAGGPGGGSRLPLNLGVVIDRSGSMYDERRLEFVVEAVKFLADNLTADDKISIVAFADKAKVLITPEAARDKSAIKRAIDDIDLLEIGGGTQMALGMRAAIDEVKKNLSPDRLNRVLVLTDGQTYEETACIELAEKNRDQISFSTMGVGVEFNEKLLQRIAQDSNGKYHFIGDPAEIPQIFEDELEGLRSVSVRNGRIEVTLSQGVQVREAFRASPEIYVLGTPLVGEDRKIGYEIGDLQAGVPGSVLLTLVLPPRKPGQVRILQSNFHYEVPGGAEGTCRVRSDGRLHARSHADEQAQRARDEPGRPGLDRQAAIEGGRGAEGGQRRSRDAAARQRAAGHAADGQRQGDAGAVGSDRSDQEDADAADQGGEDHAAAGAGGGAQDADARSRSVEGFPEAG